MTRPLVKICGMCRVEDAVLAADLGANALGFIFWPGSPRFIDPYRAKKIAAALPPFVTTVGVFVDQPVEYVAGVAGLLNLGAVQLHGSEDPTAYGGTASRIIKAVPLASQQGNGAVQRLPASVTVLLDAHDPVKRGGTGRTIDWAEAAAVASRRRVILSGGLSAENVQAAIAQVRPYGIDVSSGVESAPGRKDAARLRAFFAALDRIGDVVDD